MGKTIVGGLPGGGGEKKPSVIGLGILRVQADYGDEPAVFTDATADIRFPVDTVLTGKTVRFFACEPASMYEYIYDAEGSSSYIQIAAVACLVGGTEIKPGEEFVVAGGDEYTQCRAKFSGQHGTPTKWKSGFRTTCGFKVDLWEMTIKCKGWRTSRPSSAMSLYVRAEVYD